MIWLTWRQHRAQLLFAAAVLAAFAAVVFVTGSRMRDSFGSSGLGACLASGRDCGALSEEFLDQYGTVVNSTVYLVVLPVLIGLFWGAPLLARELEQGTHRLVWTQTTSRTHWLTVKFAALIATTILAGLGLAALLSWWFRPFQQVQALSRINPDVFGLVGIAPIGYALFAFALGAAAGTVLHRVIPAMAVTLVGFIAVRLVVAGLRERFLAPLTVSYPAGEPSPRAGRGDWIVSNSGFVDGSGRHFDSLAQVCPIEGTDRAARLACLNEHGIQQIDVFHPDSHFWPLQGIETGIFVALAVLLLAFTAWWAVRRIG